MARILTRATGALLRSSRTKNGMGKALTWVCMNTLMQQSVAKTQNLYLKTGGRWSSITIGDLASVPEHQAMGINRSRGTGEGWVRVWVRRQIGNITEKRMTTKQAGNGWG